MNPIKRLALFAHWDPDSIVDPTVIAYLENLKGIADIVFYSDCDLPTKELNKVGPYTINQGANKHEEYDFGSYKRAYQLARHSIEKYDEIILANDSCYGGLKDLKPFVEKMSESSCDYWGFYESLDEGHSAEWHLQSFFIVFKKPTSGSLINFLEKVQKQKNKKQVIREYEIGLSEHFEKTGFKRESTIRDEKPIAYTKESIKLFNQNVVPIIKTPLFSKNRLKEPDLSKTFMETPITHRQKLQILEHLNRTTKGGYAKSWNIPPIRQRKKTIFRLTIKTGNKHHWARIAIKGMVLLKVPVRKTSTHEDIVRLLKEGIS